MDKDSKNKLASHLIPKNIDKLHEYYNISLSVSTPSYYFFFYGKEVYVDGDLENPPQKSDYARKYPEFLEEYEGEIELWNSLPKEILDAFKTAISYDNKNSKRWLPEFIEVNFWPYTYASGESIIWPNDWPDLNDKKTIKTEEDFYSVYIPSKHYNKLIKIMKKQARNFVIIINNKKMLASLRFPLPKEELWLY